VVFGDSTDARGLPGIPRSFRCIHAGDRTRAIELTFARLAGKMLQMASVVAAVNVPLCRVAAMMTAAHNPAIIGMVDLDRSALIEDIA
jgi:hypothetical protein